MIGRKCHSTVPGVTKGELVEEFRGPLCYASQHCLGTRCFGKGSVQTVIPLPASRAIRLTTRRQAALFRGWATTGPAGRGNPPGSAVPWLVGRQCEVPGARGDPDDPSARSPGQSRALLPVLGVSGFFITAGPHHIRIPPETPRCDSV